MRHPAPTDPRETSDAASGSTVSGADRRPGLTPMTLFLVLLLAYVMIQVQLVLVITLLALVFATVIERPVQLLERRHVPRAAAILTIYVGLVGAVVLLIVGIVPTIGDEAGNLRDQLPGQLRELEAEWRGSANPVLSGTGANLMDQAQTALDRPPEPPQDAAVGILTGIVGGIVGALAMLAIAFYYLMEKPLLKRLILDEMSPPTRTRAARVWDDVEDKVGGWVRGQLTLCLIIGFLATVGYGILDVRFWPLLGLIAGVTEIIPIIGPWLGGIPAVIVALTDGWQKAAFVVGFIVILQLLENTVLVPRVMRGAVGLTPLTVFVAVLAGTTFIGPAGAILAIPIAALIQVVVTDYLDARRLARHAPGETAAGWRWMRNALTPSRAAEHGLAGANAGGTGGPSRQANGTARPSGNRDGAAPVSAPPIARPAPEDPGRDLPPNGGQPGTAPAARSRATVPPAPAASRRGATWSREVLQRRSNRPAATGQVQGQDTTPAAGTVTSDAAATPAATPAARTTPETEPTE